jgi:hypothetical protein
MAVVAPLVSFVSAKRLQAEAVAHDGDDNGSA